MRTWDKLEKAGNSWRYRCCDRKSRRHRQCRTSHGVADKEARYQQVRPIRITSRHRRGQSEYARVSLLHYAYIFDILRIFICQVQKVRRSFFLKVSPWKFHYYSEVHRLLWHRSSPIRAKNLARHRRFSVRSSSRCVEGTHI